MVAQRSIAGKYLLVRYQGVAKPSTVRDQFSLSSGNYMYWRNGLNQQRHAALVFYYSGKITSEYFHRSVVFFKVLPACPLVWLGEFSMQFNSPRPRLCVFLCKYEFQRPVDYTETQLLTGFETTFAAPAQHTITPTFYVVWFSLFLFEIFERNITARNKHQRQLFPAFFFRRETDL